MALRTMIEKLNEAKAAYENQLEAIGADAQKAVAEFLQPLIPPGFRLRWEQYTPYFNDGEACTFGVNEPSLVRPGATRDDNDEDEDDDEDRNSIELYSAIRKYGTPDKIETYTTKEYVGRGQPEREVQKQYTDYGFPAIEGWSAAKLQELKDAWQSLPEDLMQKAFGDHVRCSISATGSIAVDDYEHD